MSKTHFVGCRIDKQLFNKLNKHPLGNSDLIRKAVKQYFREGEPNNRVEDYVKHPYNTELVTVLNNQIEELRTDKQFLQQQVQALTVVKNPSLGEWLRFRLSGNNSKP